jgi:hypothetical protein
MHLSLYASSDGFTPLLLAVAGGSSEIVEALLYNGIDVSICLCIY